jgi:hypothetical protein
MICVVMDETRSKRCPGTEVHYIAKIVIKIEINIPRHLTCSHAHAQVDRTTNFPTPPRRFGKDSQKMARCCRVEGPPTDGDLLFVYFLVSRSISLCRENVSRNS